MDLLVGAWGRSGAGFVICGSAWAGLAVGAVGGAGSESAGVDAVDDVVAVAGGRAREVESAVVRAAAGGVVRCVGAGRGVGKSGAANAAV